MRQKNRASSSSSYFIIVALLTIASVVALLLASIAKNAESIRMPKYPVRVVESPVLHQPPLNTSYGPSASETALVYKSPTPNSPMVIIVHGGAWVGGENTDYGIDPLARYLQSTGVTVLAINYDLATPSFPAFPNQVNEVALSASVAAERAGLYNGNPRRISLIGGSSGGTLVADAAQVLTARGVRVQSVTDFSGPSNFASYAAFAAANPDVLTMLGPALPDALACPNMMICPRSALMGASPVSHTIKGPHWVLVASSRDPLVPLAQSEEEATALELTNAKVTTIYSSARLHAFELETEDTDALIRSVV